jgi:hypothetical protein
MFVTACVALLYYIRCYWAIVRQLQNYIYRYNDQGTTLWRVKVYISEE